MGSTPSPKPRGWPAALRSAVCGCRAVVEAPVCFEEQPGLRHVFCQSKAAIAAITGDQSCVEATRQAYQQRRDVLVEGLNALGWPCKAASHHVCMGQLPRLCRRPKNYYRICSVKAACS